MHVLESHVLVMSGFSLGRGGKHRIGELFALPQPGRHLLAGQGLRFLVLLPRAAREVAAHHALEIDALRLAHDHEAARELLPKVLEHRGQVGDHA